MPQPFSSQLDLKLLNLVKNNPVLYNPRHPKYSDSDTREVTWQKISDALNKPTAKFAGIQCQIQFGDYNEEKHKSGFIENLREYLPEQYCSSWGIEKKILKEFSSHVGLNELEAKHLYTKTARELPTYGVTFFLVKEQQKGKKKLVPRLLGISAEAVLRLDERTKQVLQVWPLTHVKTYHVGKGEVFTLNFGDYIDKEYSVKTRDAFRIRDILEGYIDLIRKRMLANYNQSQNEAGYISTENISSGQSSMVQHISNSPMKIVEQTYVGPSKIVQCEPGQTLSQGTQAGTAQQMLISELIKKQGQGVKSEVPLRKDMGIPFARRLNRLNSNSVKIVTLLTEPSQAHIEDAKKIVDEMNADMPFVRDGVKETVAKQSSEEEKKKLQDQLHELDELLKLLSQNTDPGAAKPSEAEDVAKQVADLTTQMYFAIAPEPKRRSKILSKSRNSFIADERTEKNLRRASFIAATAGATHAIDNATDILEQEYKGPALTAEQIEELEKSAVDKLGKINAAIAHYLLAHSDPQNIDYATAVNSLHTIHELTPELAKDGQALASVGNTDGRRELLKDIKELCAAAKHVCSLSGNEDTEKLQEASAKYAGVAGKLVYVFDRGSKARAEKKNQIIDLAKEARAKTADLVSSAKALAERPGAEAGAAELTAAGAAATARAKDLVAQAVLNGPTLEEPHCRSALLAASEALSSASQRLATAWRPLVEHPEGGLGEALRTGTMDLAAALDRLREACRDTGGIECGSESAKPGSEAQRLKFITSLSRVGSNLQDAENDLSKPVADDVSAAESAEAERRLAGRVARLDAGLAALLAATADRSSPDYTTAESAADTISEMISELVKDSKIASANKDEASQADLLDNIKHLCEVSRNVCASAYGAKPEDLNEAVAKYAAASGKLTYVVNRRVNPDRESQIIEQTSAVCSQASVLLSGVQQLEEGVGGERGAELDERGAALAEAAQALLTTAQLTSPSMSDPRCQSAMVSAIDRVSGCGAALAEAWQPLAEHEALQASWRQLGRHLDKLRATCQLPYEEEQVGQVSRPVDSQEVADGSQHQEKIKFVMTMNGARGKLADAQKELDKPTVLAKGADVDKVQHRLSQGLAGLNAAVAALLAATADRDKLDYVAAQKAATTISELTPQIIRDTKTVSASKDEPTRAAMLAQVKKICEASEGICAGFDGSNAQGLNDAVTKYTDASGKLVYVVTSRVNPHRGDKIISLSSATCGATSDLLSGVQQLAEGVGGERGQELDMRGRRVADAAQALLQAAQITAPSISSPECQEALISTVDNLSGAGQRLAAALAPLQDDHQHKQTVHSALQALQRLDVQLDELRKACKETDSQDHHQGQQKQQFIRTLQGAKEKWAIAQKELNKPPTLLRGADVEKAQLRLSQRLGELNAAIAALLSATADREKPRYAEAEHLVNTITNLLPQIIQDTKTVSADKDEPTRVTMLSQIREICKASEAICAGSDGGKPQDINDVAAKFADASGKLVYVVNPRANPQKEDQIINLTSAACGATSVLLSGVQQLAEGVGGERGQELDARGGRVAEAAQALLQTALITAPSMSSPQCQEALISSADDVSAAGHRLASSLDDLHDDVKHSQQAQQLKKALQQLQAQIDALRKACRTHDGPPPSAPPQAAPPLPATKPPVAHAVRKRSGADVTQDFLERLRFEESMAQSPHQSCASPKTVTHPTSPSVISKVGKVKPPPPARRTDDDKVCKLHQLFVETVDDAEKSIKLNEASLMKLCKTASSSGPALNQGEMMRKQVALQRSLAQAGVQVASLVAANYADKIDYTAASKATKALPQLLNSIIEDGTQLSDNVTEMARKAMLYDMLQLCGAATDLCRAAKTDRQKLNETAVSFGDASTKLLHVVSTDVDPDLEKEIISRAKAIGDSASRLALDAAGIATAPSGTASNCVQRICDAGTACVDAAGKLVYTAKLTAPSIHEPACQAALAGSADVLSAQLKSFALSWEPLALAPQQSKIVSELTKEASSLEQKVEGLRGDVRGGLHSRRELERLRVSDTPLRGLAIRVLRDAQTYVESPELATSRQIEYAAYADRVKEAVRAVDIALARCNKTPHDTNKRRELEGAIQNLQMVLLQSRPRRGDKGDSNIVDLRDFIEEVSSEAKNMRLSVSGIAVPTAQDKRALEEIKEICERIEEKASKVMNVDTRADLESTFNDILEVDQLGEECDDLIKEINSNLKEMEDAKAKRLLYSKMLPLSESCNLLRFATKSGISTEACATLDSTLDDLDDIEARVITSIVRDADATVTLRPKQPLVSGDSPATMNLCREVATSTGVSAPAVTAYIVDAASRTDTANPEERNKLLKHLYKLVHLLKTLTVTTSKCAATWQPHDGPEIATITEQIMQEIHNPESKFGIKAGEMKQLILNEGDIAKLLIPAAPKILGDKKQQEEKLAQLSSKLSSMCGLVTQGVTSPAALARSARAAADVACELDGIARGTHLADHIQRKKLDEAAKEMSFATYKVLKTAENAGQDPNNSVLRRKLVITCETLNEAIDKLVCSASTSGPVAKTAGALSRAAALQLSCLAPRACDPAPFDDTCDLLTQQADNIYKIKSDAPMPRREFMRHLDELGSAVRVSTDCAAQCAYFIALSDKQKDIAKTGLVDVPQIQKSIESIQDSCMAIIGASQVDQAKEQKEELQKRVQEFSGALDKAQVMVHDGEMKRTLVRARSRVSEAADDLGADLTGGEDMDKITPKAVNLLEAVNQAHCMIEKCPLVPVVGDMSPDTKAKCDDVMDHSKALLRDTLALLKDVNSSPEEEETLTWVTYSTSRRKLLEAYDALVKSVKKNGSSAGIYEKSPEEEIEEPAKKSYLDIQVDLANSWLKRPVCKPEAKAIGQQAVRNVVDMARQMSEDMKGTEREEVRNLIAETEQLLCECGKKYDHEKNSILMDRVKELKKCIRRGAVTRVVEEFAGAESPLVDLHLEPDEETDETKRKFILERKIASLLAQLGRVTRTARFVAGASAHRTLGTELMQCSEQTELLAPMLVQAAQQRIDHPDDKVVIEKYKTLLAQYAESISKVRDLCDRAVDPMDFVQAAGDTMQRMREEMTQHNNDPQKCAYSSAAITSLANRVIHVGMSSCAVRSDPELQKALVSAKERLHAITPAPHTRASRLPDWRESTAEILRTTGDVESALGGENIFKREPTTANQPIYSVARSLHESVREWSARDNEIVAVARRMAVLMARLSDYMETDKQQALIATSKSIVSESQEVAELAKKLAHECTDLRIKTNLLQTCERIPTISGQLKMLTTVKGSSLGHQGSQADKEAMDMLVVNAQSLMMSIQEVVKAAAGASVKIMSQRGPRLRWVRKNFY